MHEQSERHTVEVGQMKKRENRLKEDSYILRLQLVS